MRGLLPMQRISAATWRVYAAALAVRQAGGAWPEPETVRRLAHAEGADADAALVLTHFALPAAAGSGRLVPLDGCDDLLPPVVLPTAETIAAILATGRAPTVILHAPWGREIRRRDLAEWEASMRMQHGQGMRA